MLSKDKQHILLDNGVMVAGGDENSTLHARLTSGNDNFSRTIVETDRVKAINKEDWR